MRTQRSGRSAPAKQRLRENEDYEYREQLGRKKAQDWYDEEAHLLAQKNEARQRELERTQREANLAERAEELARLRQHALRRRIAAEKEAALAEATRQATAHYEQQILVLQKDAEAERKVAALQITGRQETLLKSAAPVQASFRRMRTAPSLPRSPISVWGPTQLGQPA